MNYNSILNFGEDSELQPYYPSLFMDLNIDTIVETISQKWGSDISSFYTGFPKNEAIIQYRHELLCDVQREEIYDILYHFCLQLDQCITFRSNKEEVTEEIQKAVWHIRETDCYCSALQSLYEQLSSQKPESHALLSFLEDLEHYLSSSEYQAITEKVTHFAQQLNSYRIRITYADEKIVVSDAAGLNSYENFLSKMFPEHQSHILSPFLSSLDLCDLEAEVLNRYMKKNKTFYFESVAFMKEHPVIEEDMFFEFRKDLPFYLSFVHFQKYMKNSGFDFCQPSLSADRTISATELYDLALACVNIEENKQVVSNDVLFQKQEKFNIVTGPNQGGKTTYARSLGQMIFFTKMGLDIPAVSGKTPLFDNILTHFNVEESLESGKGKLKEELTRLAPMMKEDANNAFIVINELFTTAANYDATIMGKKVLNHFMDMNCMGIYVTHLNELASPSEGIVSLRAMKDEAGSRNFKVQRSAPSDSANALDQVKKYGLTYEQLKERLS